MPQANKADCVRAIVEATGSFMTEMQANALLAKIEEVAGRRSAAKNININQALTEIAGELAIEVDSAKKLRERDMLMTIRAKRAIRSFTKNFPTLGEGLQALLEGTNKPIRGGRLSVDYQAKAVYTKYLGKLVSDLESEGVMRDFVYMDEDFARAVYQEMGELARPNGQPGVSGNERAQKVARIVESTTAEMVSHENRVGAYKKKHPGYIHHQTHDTAILRSIGTKAQSFAIWREFVLTRVDPEKTFHGEKADDFLQAMHDSLYSAVYAREADDADANFYLTHGDPDTPLMNKLHFKDAMAAFEYNQKFGMRSFKDQIFHDIFFRSKNIAMLDNFGPNYDKTFKDLVKEMLIDAKKMPDADKQADSLKSWKIQAAYDEVSGRAHIPRDPTLGRILNDVRAITTVARQGFVTLKSLGDKGFLQTEMLFQGVSQLETLTEQVLAFAGRTSDEKQALQLMGVALDGMTSNAISRYSFFHKTSHGIHEMQKTFFQMNFLNWWTDVHKASAGKLMASHLGRLAPKEHGALPPQMQMLLNEYQIGAVEWDAIRSITKEVDGNPWVTPDGIQFLPDEHFPRVLKAWDLKDTPANRRRVIDTLETRLRTYFVDRVDFAIPTPGTAERKYTTLGMPPGTPLGEAMRTLLMFKTFPITVMTKVLNREIYGRGADSFMDWLIHDRGGKMPILMLLAMTTIGGYMSGAIIDALKGRTPRRLVTDGEIEWGTLNDAMIRGGAMGLLGDVMFTEFDRHYKTAANYVLGPVGGQLTELFALPRSSHPAAETGKVLLNNLPFMNLFYIRPILDYLVLWNMQEMMSPGYLRSMEDQVRDERAQDFWLEPSSTTR